VPHWQRHWTPLNSDLQRFPAHKFYLREGFNLASHHFLIVNIT
jgi:hypothetical protein